MCTGIGIGWFVTRCAFKTSSERVNLYSSTTTIWLTPFSLITVMIYVLPVIRSFMDRALNRSVFFLQATGPCESSKTCRIFIIRVLLSSPLQKHNNIIGLAVVLGFVFVFVFVFVFSQNLPAACHIQNPCVISFSKISHHMQVCQVIPLFVSVFLFVFVFSSEFGQLTSWAFRKYTVLGVPEA